MVTTTRTPPATTAPQVDWDKLRIFHQVAEAGSFTHAGESLGLSQSAVSRQISALEESLRVPLFHRHARGLILTEQGELLFRTVHDVFAKLAVTQAMLSDLRDVPKGELRITTSIAFGTYWLTPRIQEFTELYPEIRTHLILDDDASLNLAMREADVAIRFAAPVQPELVQRRLALARYHIYASQAYLKRRGLPRAIEDLDRHQLLVYGAEASGTMNDLNWLLVAGIDGRAREAHFSVNNLIALITAAESDLGLALLPDYLVRGNNRLVQVLPEVNAPAREVYFVYPETLRDTKRVVVFREFLIRKMAEFGF